MNLYIKIRIILEIYSKIKFIKSNYIFHNQKAEIEIGNREYKLSLNYNKFTQETQKSIINKKTTQMNYRLNEGSGKALYIIGIQDNGIADGINLLELLKSLYYFTLMCHNIDCKYKCVRIYRTKIGYLATIRINKAYHDISTLLELN